MTRTICADTSGALTALVALLRSLHSSPEVRLEAARALRMLATKADETDGESVAAVARALGLDASKLWEHRARRLHRAMRARGV